MEGDQGNPSPMEPEDDWAIAGQAPGVAAAATATFGSAPFRSSRSIWSSRSIDPDRGRHDRRHDHGRRGGHHGRHHDGGRRSAGEIIESNPTLVMLALPFLVMIGLVLIADGSASACPRAISTPPWVSRSAWRSSTSPSAVAVPGSALQPGRSCMTDFRKIDDGFYASLQISVADVASGGHGDWHDREQPPGRRG